MDNTTLIIGTGALAVLITVILLVARPFGGIRRSGDDHEAGSHAWIGANHHHGDSGGGDSGSGSD